MKFLGLIGALAIHHCGCRGRVLFRRLLQCRATQPDLGVVAWALEYIRDARSIGIAIDQPPVSMEDPATIQVGARAFASRGCPSCSRWPRGHVGEILRGSAPRPSRSQGCGQGPHARANFWVIRNGINMTGMPGSILSKATDLEIWNIAAFVKSSPQFRKLTTGYGLPKRARYQAKPHRPSSGGCRPDLANHRATRRSRLGKR